MDDCVSLVFHGDDGDVDGSDGFGSQLAIVVNCGHCEEDGTDVDRFGGDDDGGVRDRVMLPLMSVEYESQIEPFFYKAFLFVNFLFVCRKFM